MMFNTIPGQNDTMLDRLWSYVEPSSPGCWLWTGNIPESGYPQFRIGGQGSPKVCAHRVVYEVLVGPIPSEHELDHLCLVRHCVNPDHLEPVTKLVNWRRGHSPSRLNSSKSSCASGHELTADNTYVQPKTGFRYCRTCQAARRRTFTSRQKVAA